MKKEKQIFTWEDYCPECREFLKFEDIWIDDNGNQTCLNCGSELTTEKKYK